MSCSTQKLLYWGVELFICWRVGSWTIKSRSSCCAFNNADQHGFPAWNKRHRPGSLWGPGRGRSSEQWGLSGRRAEKRFKSAKPSSQWNTAAVRVPPISDCCFTPKKMWRFCGFSMMFVFSCFFPPFWCARQFRRGHLSAFHDADGVLVPQEVWRWKAHEANRTLRLSPAWCSSTDPYVDRIDS